MIWSPQAHPMRIDFVWIFLMWGCVGLEAVLPHRVLAAGDRIFVPVRWCGVEGAPSMVNPAAVGESTTDDVMLRRHERATDAIYQDFVDMRFRSGSPATPRDAPQSFPIIRDPSGSGGDLIDLENSDAVTMCRRAWMMGDPLYLDEAENGVVNAGTDTLLSTSSAEVGFIDLGHDGAELNAVPGDVRYVDTNANGSFDISERIYRDENGNGSVDTDDTLLVQTSGTVVGDVGRADVSAPLRPVPARVKYLDLIREPKETYNIGYPMVQGITAVSANDIEHTAIEFPVHGIAAEGLGGLAAVMDDPSQYIPACACFGPFETCACFRLFETQLVGHEFGHAFGLPHGDGIDDDMNGALDDEDDDDAPFPGAQPGTLCDSNNVMSYCWRDDGASGNPDLTWIGVGAPESGVLTTAQRDAVRTFVLDHVSDRIVDPVTPPLVAARVDTIGEIKAPLEHIDIAEFSVRVDAARADAILSLQTRRPFPPDATGTMNFYYLLDTDGDATTGGTAEALKALNIPGDFTGAEYVAEVRFRDLEVSDVALLQYQPDSGRFERVPSQEIRAVRETVNMIVDFPFGRPILDPDRPSPGVVEQVPAKETISVIIPNAILGIAEHVSMRVEYVSQDAETGTLDRARSSGMNFKLPVFPNCRTEPPSIPQGGNTTVIATGLLPNREVHLLLGDTEVASGTTNASGNTTISMPIPSNAKTGERLVTVGALAVSADCSVEVVRDTGDGRPEDIRRTARYTYAVNFVCGRSFETMQEGVVKGVHQTLITIHNPSLEKKVRFAKRVARALPDQTAGFLSEYQTDVIGPQHSISIECNEVRKLMPVPMTEQFRSGMLVIATEEKLDVTAVYTARPTDGDVSSMDIEIIDPRMIGEEN